MDHLSAGPVRHRQRRVRGGEELVILSQFGAVQSEGGELVGDIELAQFYPEVRRAIHWPFWRVGRAVRGLGCAEAGGGAGKGLRVSGRPVANVINDELSQALHVRAEVIDEAVAADRAR